MKVKMNDTYTFFRENLRTLVDETGEIYLTIIEIYANYCYGDNFHFIGEWDNVEQTRNYINFKSRELIHNKLPLISDLFPDGENILKNLNGSKRSVSYVGAEKMDNTTFSQSENSPINNDIEDIQTPILKNAGKGNNTRSFEDRKDIHEYTSIDEMIKKYDFLTREDYMTLHSFCEKNFVLPFVDEFNTMY